MSMSPRLSAALDGLKRGWSVVPLCPPDHDGVSGAHEHSCRRPGREPLVEASAYRDRKPREAELRLLWARTPRAGVGLLLGAASGLVGLDVGGSAGEVLLLEQSGGDELPPTLEFLTAEGGRCLLFALPPGMRLPAEADVGHDELRPLGEGSVVPLPPTPDYEWVAGHGPDDVAPAPCPPWLLATLGAEVVHSAPPKEEKVAPEAPTSRIDVRTAAQLMAQELSDLRWAIPGLLPEGGTILAGRPKTGKSWLTLGLAAAVAAGAAALDGKPTPPGDVLYLALEDGPRRLRRRLDMVLRAASLAPPERLHLATTWPRVGRGGLQRLGEWLHGHPGSRLVVIDTLARLRDRRGDGAAYEEDYRTLAALKDLGDRYACAVVVVHHTRKGDAADPLEAVAGTLGLTGAADCVLLLRHHRQSEDGRLYVTGRDVDEREVLLRWDASRCRWSLGDGGPTPEQRAVLEALRRRGSPAAPSDLAPVLGKSADAVKQLLRRMADDYGVLRHGTRRGTYELPPASEARADGA